MYFIAKGKCVVTVRDKFSDISEAKVVQYLGPGQHFGEISMLLNCPRSVTVTSKNYLTCSSINRAQYNELLVLYPSLNDLLKEKIILYTDPLKVWKEMCLDLVDYFKNLPKIVKAEIIFNMSLRTYEKGSHLYRQGDLSNEMYLIQFGQIEISHIIHQGKATFVLERLCRGSIINHNSFLMNDEMDTDAKCATNVTVFYLSVENLRKLRSRHIELDKAIDKHELNLVAPGKAEPAIDYIIRDETVQPIYFKRSIVTGEMERDYKKEQYINSLTVKLKNAVLVKWGQVKKKRERIDIREIIRRFTALQ